MLWFTISEPYWLLVYKLIGQSNFFLFIKKKKNTGLNCGRNPAKGKIGVGFIQIKLKKCTFFHLQKKNQTMLRENPGYGPSWGPRPNCASYINVAQVSMCVCR